jgi:prepilin-type N-terminal cleavage/methylation domain-containing protein
MKRNNKRKGFTLVEIMIVVLIIGILLAIAVPNFITARRNSRLQTVVANLKQVEAGKEQCAMDEGLVVGDTCSDLGNFIKDYANMRWPVQGTFVEAAIGTDPTFRGKTASQWEADPSGL